MILVHWHSNDTKKDFQEKNHLKFHHPEITAQTYGRITFMSTFYGLICIYNIHRITPDLLFCNFILYSAKVMSLSSC